MAGLAGFQDALARKYDILQEQADTARNTGAAQAGLLNKQSDFYGSEAAARNALAAGQAAQAQAGAELTGTQSRLAPQTAFSENQLRGAQGNELNANAALNRYSITPNASLTQAIQPRLFPSGAPSFDSTSPTGTGSPVGSLFHGIGGGGNIADVSGFGFSSGATKVPGQGDGTVDKVPAMLAPGEAVLNRAAAEHLGRHTIEFLNQIGAAKMGLSPHGMTGGTDTEDDRAKGNIGQSGPDIKQMDQPTEDSRGKSSAASAKGGNFTKKVDSSLEGEKAPPGYKKGTKEVSPLDRGGHDPRMQSGNAGSMTMGTQQDGPANRWSTNLPMFSMGTSEVAGQQNSNGTVPYSQPTDEHAYSGTGYAKGTTSVPAQQSGDPAPNPMHPVMEAMKTIAHYCMGTGMVQHYAEGTSNAMEPSEQPDWAMYSKGTSKVPPAPGKGAPGKSRPVSAKNGKAEAPGNPLPPQLMQAIMAMGQGGGGGMPSPGGAAPMPMQMPQVGR